jgi:Co/Zn/Cd efflux system component
MGDLAGFASAIILALIALLVAWERLLRLRSPAAIYYFQEAIAVAFLGLGVNIACAWPLKDDHEHHHDHGHDPSLEKKTIQRPLATPPHHNECRWAKPCSA